MEDSLYQEALHIAKTFDIPECVIDSYYEAFVKFVREEIDKRIKTGVSTKINIDIFISVIMTESGWSEYYYDG